MPGALRQTSFPQFREISTSKVTIQYRKILDESAGGSRYRRMSLTNSLFIMLISKAMKLTILYNNKPVYSDFGWASVGNGAIVREHGVLQYLSTNRHILKEIWGIELTGWISVIIADFTISHGCLRSHSNSSSSHYQPEDRYGA